MKNNFRSKRTTQILIIIAALAIFIVGVFIWYFSYKKPHDQAIAKYTAIVSDYNSLIPRYDSVAADFDAVISDMNTATQKLDDVIVSAQNIIDSNEPPYEEATLMLSGIFLLPVATQSHQIKISMNRKQI